jgi:AcrR family transcriptional regulator
MGKKRGKDMTKTIHQQRSENTNRRFLELISKKIKNGDVDHITIRGLCTELGLSPRTFYLYFKSKEQAIMKCYIYFSEEQISEFLKRKADYPDPYEWLMQVFIEHQNLLLRDPKLCRESIICTLHYYEETLFDDAFSLLSIIREAIEDCISQGKFELNADADTVANELFTLSRGIQIDYLRRNASFDLVETALDRIQRYLSTFLIVQK